ncbi:capping complex subunit for YIEGIA [Anaerosinus massiliensis]|uniref:capping complex subunit for YIEGIA n=1 Tax=Massilibacillus massiliensis TaxID=1806837 RepID=UPI000DA6003B|nr:hypothetical protein [Massilibacillus massiliensis]
MGNEYAQVQSSIIIAAVVLSCHKVTGGTELIIEARDEKEQEKLTVEISKAVKGDVMLLSNGIYLVLRG